jgi:hypothetical protein
VNNQLIKFNGGITIDDHVKLTPTGLSITGEITQAEHAQLGKLLMQLEQSIQWLIGDWLAYGERVYSVTYQQVAEETGYSYQTLKDYTWVANHVNPSIRIDKLSFDHHRLVASMEPAQQAFWLNSAASEGWSREQMRQEIKQAKRAALASSVKVDDSYNLFHADLNWLHDKLPDNSVDLFFTDPPYHADKPYLFGELAELAADKLKDDGLLLTYSGQMHLPQVMNDMSHYLDYWWIFSVRHTGGHLTIWNRHLWNDWKPVLVFSKKGQTPIAAEWVQDFIDGGGRDKTYHDWGQDANEATYWIEKLTDPGALVCDPFVGGGAIPVACYLTKRRWVGTEIDETTLQIARQRLQKVHNDSRME